MTVEELKTIKVETEEKINRLLASFERETGVKVSNMGVFRIKDIDDKYKSSISCEETLNSRIYIDL